MPFTFTMPKLSPTMEEGTVVKWLKKEGEFVEAGETLLEIATDKATVEHEALDEGYLRKIIVDANGVAVVNQAIAVFTEEKDESIDGYTPEGITPAPEPVLEEVTMETAEQPVAAAKPAAATMSQPAFVPEPPLEDYKFTTQKGHVVASPLAKKMAKQQGLDLTSVRGSGPRGRIVAADVSSAPPAGDLTFGVKGKPDYKPGEYEEEALSPMRRIIGKRLQESKSFIPHFYVTQEINADLLMQLREQLKGYKVKLSVNDFIMRASALALRKHPEVNSGYNTVSDKIIRFKTVDISVAVSIPDGLMTPVIRYADYKNIGELSAEVRGLALKARDGKLMPEEYKGGSFTISNLGMYGIFDFKAVINPPQAAILAVGGILKQPVVKGDEIVPGHVMKVTLAADHRVIDGAAAAQFLVTLKEYLENPAGLLV